MGWYYSTITNTSSLTVHLEIIDISNIVILAVKENLNT